MSIYSFVAAAPAKPAPEPAVARLMELGLTERQAEIFAYIVEELLRSGIQPSMREIAKQFGIRSPNAIMCHFHAIRRKGWIELSDTSNRSLRLLRTIDGRPFTGLAFRED